MQQRTSASAHDITAIILFLGLIMSAALTLTIAECCQHRNRRRLPSDASSRMLLALRQLSDETSFKHRSWHHIWQQSKEQDLEQARSCSTIPRLNGGGYGTFSPLPGSGESPVLPQRISSSFISILSSSCSSMLTSLAPSEVARDAQLIGPHSFSHTYNHIQTLTYCSEGPVHVVEHRTNGKRYVIKQVPARRKLPHEAAILQKIQRHPNIIEISDTLQGYTAERRKTSDIVTPFAELGDLSDVIVRLCDSGDYAPRALVLHFVTSMIDALAFLHSGDISYDARSGKTSSVGHRQPSIIHRDIKPLNIFMTATSTTPGLPQFILADFGLSCMADNNFGVVGTRSYQAPEILDFASGSTDYSEDCDQLQDVCTKAGDMYAFGVSLFELIFCYAFHPLRPFADELRFTYVEDDIEIHDLLKACLADDPAARPTASSLHALSANIKTELDTWRASGGRLPEYLWADPLSFDRQRAQHNSRTTGKAPTTATATASDYSFDDNSLDITDSVGGAVEHLN